jgi:hypothetical protein
LSFPEDSLKSFAHAVASLNEAAFGDAHRIAAIVVRRSLKSDEI